MTLVSHDHRFIFLKTRKTAGTSVEMFLQPFCTAPGHPVQEWNEAIVSEHGIVGQRLGRTGRAKPAPAGVPRDVWFSHQSANDLKSKLPARQWRSYEKITVVRNPFAKVLSAFFWNNRKTTLPDDMTLLVEQFRKFVAKDSFRNDHEVVHAKNWFGATRFVPQTVLRTEHLDDDLLKLITKLGLDASKTSLPVTKNSGSRPKQLPLSQWYDTHSVAIVRNRLQWMFDAGQYEKYPV